MSSAQNVPATEASLALLRESYEGVPDNLTWYGDSGPTSGLLPLLASIPAGTAARPPAPGRKSIAQHARHVRFHLETTLKFLRGDRSHSNWDESWTVDAHDQPAWSREIAALRSAYEAVRDAAPAALADDWLRHASAFGTVAHAAYHLGAIRQLVLSA